MSSHHPDSPDNLDSIDNLNNVDKLDNVDNPHNNHAGSFDGNSLDNSRLNGNSLDNSRLNDNSIDGNHHDERAHPEHPRMINTFMRRRTHVSKHAEIALSDPRYRQYIVNSVDARNNGLIAHITDLHALFDDGRSASQPSTNHPSASQQTTPLTLEIGFGMGGSLIEMAAADPARNFVGVEVHEPGIGKCAYMAGELGLTNLKLIHGDAIRLLQQLPANHIDRIQLYFPDPWQKKRHHKRRFVSPSRMQLVTRCLRPQGWFHTATDWEHYAFWMLDVLDNLPGLTNVAGRGHFSPRPDFRPLTKFEQRGLASGHGVWDLIYRKK